MIVLTKKLLQISRVHHRIITKRNKYIVLLPEIPSDTPENNPLLRSNILPQFSQITTQNCVNAIGRLVIEYESGIHQLDQKLYDADFQRNVQNVILPLDRLSGPLDFAWGAFKLLYTVRRNDNLADAYVKLHPRLLKAKREKYLSASIYGAFKELKENEKQLTEPVRRITDKHLLESHLSGMDLTDNAYKHFQSVMKKLDQHRINYKMKLKNSTSSFYHDLEFDHVKHFPREILKLFAVDSARISNGPWRLILEPHIYQYFLEYCNVRLLRWNAWYAYNVRASSTSGQSLNNSIEIEELRYQRSELAKVLGFKSYADLSMKTKMAGSVENVLEMITTLHVKSQATTLKEIQELQDFAKQNGFEEKLELWDIPYWQRLHKEELFNLDDAVVRQYFPLPCVLKGIFNLCHKLFGITIQEASSNVDTWHPDVTYYKILDGNGKQIASFYMDPYFRGNEKSLGSWMEVGQNHSDVTGSEPLAYMIFNFHPPVSSQPSLLTFEDLKILLQKFGHLLQHSLTTIPYADVSGLTNLEWDVVNVCPYVMSSFLKHYGTISSLSSHIESGKMISPEMHETLVKKDHYMMGLRLTEELYLSALDLELYTKREFWTNVTKRMWLQYMPFPFDKTVFQPCSFPEIFCDQYPAAYFSNLWAKMIAADVFSAFEEVGLDENNKIQQIGHRFRDTFLALGGGCNPGEVFRKFRGRDPCIDALLVSSGIMKKNHSS
ncbi:probable cytosolic oligopeptidase A isoform X2 [Stegodyphus dumicola]|uniref:probable cytosolic oligopeptidase A isoform X2 n=1 Tax=Stegodyphus dumicola TaxID=202533 RepID=UPI0015AFB073|nr:probable cytosolic oligopeptidase A isoform X2 [Stegodyphus dumicola]